MIVTCSNNFKNTKNTFQLIARVALKVNLQRHQFNFNAEKQML